jgi:hypothetical protein
MLRLFAVESYQSKSVFVDFFSKPECEFYSLKLIDSSDLEDTTHRDDPVKFHEAWQILCGAE